MKNYGIKLLAISGCFVAVYYLLTSFEGIKLDATIFYSFLTLFVVSSYLMHLILLRSVGRRPQEFINKFMGVTGLKLLVYLIALFSFVATFGKSHLIGIVVCFFVMYVSYTAFEVATLLSGIREKPSGE